MKYPVNKARERIFLVLCFMVFVCGLAGAVKIGPPLFRSVQRSLSLRQARSEWHDLLNGGVPSDDSPLYNLTIPAVGLDIPVLASSEKSNLARLPCISAVCNDRANAPVIVAHRDLHFRALQGVEVGDRVYLTRRNGERQNYRVLRVHVMLPHEAEDLAAGVQGGSLTLITCFPFRYIGPAPERFVLVCERC